MPVRFLPLPPVVEAWFWVSGFFWVSIHGSDGLHVSGAFDLSDGDKYD